MIFNLDKFISDCVTKRPVSMFAADIEANKKTLSNESKDKKVCVIGGAGSIGLLRIFPVQNQGKFNILPLPVFKVY